MSKPKHPSPVSTEDRTPNGKSLREQLLSALPVEERRRRLAGLSTAVLAGGDGPPVVLLHGPGVYGAAWMRILPALMSAYHVIAPDLPGHGSTELGDGPLDAERVLAWLHALIEQTCSAPPVLIGELFGGAIAARFAIGHPSRVSQLVLVDTFGLTPFAPAPEFASALRAYNDEPSEQTHRRLWQKCAHDLPMLRRQMGALWEPFEAYNVELARTASTQAAVQALMSEFAMAAIATADLSRITVPTTLIWGRHDLATPLAVAEAASARYGWPLHIIESANDAPAFEQPEAFTRVLLAALKERPAGGAGPRDEGRPKPAERQDVDTLVIGGGQAGLSTSYWLKRAGVEHLILERRKKLGGSWHDRWDSFHLVAPNFTLLLPGMPYAGPNPDAFMPRDEVIDYVTSYAAFCEAPMRLGCSVERLIAVNGGFEAQTGHGKFFARNVVLATGPYQQPKLPPVARLIPAGIQQLHSNEYRRPEQLADGGVLVVGTGQSGAQIAEELHHAGRDVHLAVSMCPSAPRRYRGKDVIWWLLQCFLHGAEVGVPFPTVENLPTPAARFACNPICSGKDGGHDIRLRQFAREGMHLYGELKSIDGSAVHFSDDLAARLAFADHKFDEELRPLFDAYIAAAGIAAPRDDRPPPDDLVPPVVTELDLNRAGIRSVVWATGYRLDFGWVDLPIFDEWGYPKHVRGVTQHPGLYAVGLPWLHSEPSSVFAGIGADTAHVVEHIAQHRRRQVS